VSRLARLPIRLRVTLAFTTVMALVLAAVGLFVYLRLGKELDATTDEGLRSRSADLIALVKEADIGVGEAAAQSADRPRRQPRADPRHLRAHRGRDTGAARPARRSPRASCGVRSAARSRW
jgi:hypothetical protein